MQVKKTLSTLKPYVPGRPMKDVQKEYGLEKVVKLASNENPFGTSPKVKDALQAAMVDLEYYPDGGAKDLKAAIAEFHQIPTEQILVGAGLDDVIQIISRAVLNAGDEIIVADPTFSQYELHAVVEGAKVVKVPVNDQTGEMDLNAMLQAITPKTKIIWLCNPNNPTGTYLPQDQIRDFVAQVPQEVLVISDEAYQDFVTKEIESTSLPVVDDYPNLLVMRTFSKVYGLAALRIGYAIVPLELMSAFEIVRPPFNTSTIAQKAGIEALADQDFVLRTVAINHEEREKWEHFLEARGLFYYKSQANFIYFDTKQDSTQLAHELMKRGYIVRAGLRPQWLRVTLGYANDNAKVREILAELLN